MINHILNGNILAGQLSETTIQGSHIVCAECLVEGDVSGDTFEEFWRTRTNFIASSGYTTVGFGDLHVKSIFNQLKGT